MDFMPRYDEAEGAIKGYLFFLLKPSFGKGIPKNNDKSPKYKNQKKAAVSTW